MTLRHYRFLIRNRLFMFFFRLLLLVLMLGNIAGCDRSDQGAAVPSSLYQDELFQANARIQELSIENERIRAENERLKQNSGKETTRDKESDDRIRDLIEGYGPGIWDQVENNAYPVFIKSVKAKNVQEMAAELNMYFTKSGLPGITFKKRDGTMAIIGVDNEDLLTEQMGSSGAIAYITTVTYTLTSLKGIDCVYFDIGEGDHAGPGKYCKHGAEPIAKK